MHSPAALEVRATTQQRVGGFFRNCYAQQGATCAVCYAPTGDNLCQECALHRREFGGDLADETLILTYVQGHRPDGMHQSAHVVFAYKQLPTPDAASATTMKLLIKLATAIHGECAQERSGVAWQAATFVPSAKRPGKEHPVSAVAASVHQLHPQQPQPADKFLITPGPGIDATPRMVRADRFLIPEQSRPIVEGRHVLVVDDTWTSGSKIQSAAVALKRAGAVRVTALCVARWLSWKSDKQREFIRSLDRPYDPLRCPVHGIFCPRSYSYKM